MATRRKERGYKPSEWASKPAPLLREICLELDETTGLPTGRYKVGDGSTLWADLTFPPGGGGGAVDSVNGHVGTVALTKGDVGLGSVDNTADSAKPVSTAQASAIAAVRALPTGGTDNQVLSLLAGTPSWTDTPPASLTDGQVTAPKLAANSVTAAKLAADVTQDAVPDGTTAKQYTATEKAKLSGVATGATANRSDAATDSAVAAASKSADTITDGTTNKAFTGTERTKLTGIATGATANRTDSATDALISTAQTDATNFAIAAAAGDATTKANARAAKSANLSDLTDTAAALSNIGGAASTTVSTLRSDHDDLADEVADLPTAGDLSTGLLTKANLDASGITAATWRTALNVANGATANQSDATTNAAIAASNQRSANLSDVASATTSRANLGVPTTSDAAKPANVSTKKYTDVASIRNHPALRLFHSHYNVHDTFNETGIDPVARVTIAGDSFIDIGTNVSKPERVWTSLLTQYLARNKQGYAYYQPSSAGLGNSFTSTGFPGGSTTWSASGGTPTAGGAYGLGMHSLTIPAGCTLTTTFHGDICNVFYVGLTGSSSSVAVTLDGASPAAGNPITDSNVSGPVGKVLNYGAAGEHGWHTITFTPTGGPWTISGVFPLDGMKSGLGIVWDGVTVAAGGKAGFQAAHYADSAQYWDLHLGSLNPDLMIWSLGSNDLATGTGVSPATYQANLQSVFQRVDTKLGTTTTGHMLLAWPNIANASPVFSGTGPDYVKAMYDAAAAFDPNRVCVVPVEQFIPYSLWQAQTPNDDTHPGDMLNASIASLLAEILAPGAHIRTPLDRGPIRIQAVDQPTSRTVSTSLGYLGWTETFAQADTTSSTVIDSTTLNDSSKHARRHRVWLEAGTWQGVSQFQTGTAKGIADVRINGTSLGTTDTYAASGTAIKTTTHGTQFTAPGPGFYYVEIQATGTKNASSTSTVISFVELLLRRT
jgi:hypothetical protein